MNRFGRYGVNIDYCAVFKNILNFPVLLTPAGRGVLTLLKMRPQNQLPITRDAPELKIKGFLRVSQQWRVGCVLIQRPASHSTLPPHSWAPPPLEFVAEMSLVFFCQREEEGAASGCRGGGSEGFGWQTGDRPSPPPPPLSPHQHTQNPPSAWHLPTAANPLLISSRPCAWQRRGFQISFSPPS